MTRPNHWHRPRVGRARPPGLAGTVAAVLLSVLAGLVPGSGADFSPGVTNSSNTAKAAAYFTCQAAIAATPPASTTG